MLARLPIESGSRKSGCRQVNPPDQTPENCKDVESSDKADRVMLC
jgi:hypothetical protein